MFQTAARGANAGDPDVWTGPVVVDQTRIVGNHVALAYDSTLNRVEAYAVCGTAAPLEKLCPTNARFGYRAYGNTWQVLDQPGFKTDGRLGLAYQPFGSSSLPNSNVSRGRFFMVGKTAGGGYTAPMFFSTAGNDPASANVERAKFYYWGYFYGEWDLATSMALTHNPNYDTNLRGAYDMAAGSFFSGVADGAVNTNLSDQDDYDMLTKNLRCSFSPTTSCYECAALSSNGKCSSWRSLDQAASSED